MTERVGYFRKLLAVCLALWLTFCPLMPSASAREALSVTVSLRTRTALIYTDQIVFTVSVTGGQPPYTGSARIQANGNLVWESQSLPETAMYTPVQNSKHIISVRVTDASGTTVTATEEVRVADRFCPYLDFWVDKIPAFSPDATFAEKLVTVAASQVGCFENRSDYIVTKAGVTHYASVYGEWYGLPYDDWCVMFVSFCLSKADIPEEAVPRHHRVSTLIEQLGWRYLPAKASYTPIPGDLIFLYTSGSDQPSHVGIVERVDGDTLTVIEGNSSDSVARLTYSLQESSIAGYMDMRAVMERFDEAYSPAE